MKKLKHLKTFESFNSEEIIEEGFLDKLKGVDFEKKNWKAAFGYNLKEGNEKQCQTLAKFGKELDESNAWGKATFNSKYESFFNILHTFKLATGGSIGPAPSSSYKTPTNDEAKRILKEFQENPTQWDDEIEKYAVM
jgi:hypothetical protein